LANTAGPTTKKRSAIVTAAVLCIAVSPAEVTRVMLIRRDVVYWGYGVVKVKLTRPYRFD
jgi:hypothetical protein